MSQPSIEELKKRQSMDEEDIQQRMSELGEEMSVLKKMKEQIEQQKAEEKKERLRIKKAEEVKQLKGDLPEVYQQVIDAAEGLKEAMDKLEKVRRAATGNRLQDFVIPQSKVYFTTQPVGTQGSREIRRFIGNLNSAIKNLDKED